MRAVEAVGQPQDGREAAELLPMGGPQRADLGIAELRALLAVRAREVGDHLDLARLEAEQLGVPDEVEMIAYLARAHRKQSPKLGDPEIRALRAAHRKQIRGLAAILRLADGLDRTHFRAVRGLAAELSDDRLLVRVDGAGGDVDLELWAGERRAELLSRLLGRPVVIREQDLRTEVLRVAVGSGRRA